MTQRLGLSRSTLLSLFTICTVLVLFATGATFAALSDDSQIVGTLTTGDVEIDLKDGGSATLVFNSSLICGGPIVPGTECTAADVQITNVGNLNITLGTAVIALTLSPGGTCNNVLGAGNTDWSASVSPYSYEGIDDVLRPSTTFPSDDGAMFNVTVTLLATAASGCEGRTATITVTIPANQAT